MGLISPEGWRPAANELSELLAAGLPLGDALRAVAATGKYNALFLCKAVQEACAVSQREAARVVANEITAHDSQ